MRLSQMPAMVVRESPGWEELKAARHSADWFRRHLVLPFSVLPPLCFAYAQSVLPGRIFALPVPAPRAIELFLSGAVFFVAEVVMVAYMAMLIRRMASARHHDPGPDRAYALAAVAPLPLWLSSLALLIPSRPLVAALISLAWLAAAALIRHGTRPLLDVPDEKTAHYIATAVTATGFAAWLGLLVLAAMVSSLLLGTW